MAAGTSAHRYGDRRLSSGLLQLQLNVHSVLARALDGALKVQPPCRRLGADGGGGRIRVPVAKGVG